jgi:hypothetical protein
MRGQGAERSCQSEKQGGQEQASEATFLREEQATPEQHEGATPQPKERGTSERRAQARLLAQDARYSSAPCDGGTKTKKKN